MAKGTIRRLITDRGFGFIRTKEKADLFFHRSDERLIGYSYNTEGQQVEFEVAYTQRQRRSVNVRLR